MAAAQRQWPATEAREAVAVVVFDWAGNDCCHLNAYMCAYMMRGLQEWQLHGINQTGQEEVTTAASIKQGGLLFWQNRKDYCRVNKARWPAFLAQQKYLLSSP